MTIEQEDIDFINTKFRDVEGWCWEQAALLTLWLLSAQAELGLGGPILEIGVFKGKYLSVLFQKARRNAQRVLGIDTFQWAGRDEVLSTFTQMFGSIENLSLVAQDSSSLTAAQLIEMLGGKRAAFISVDGDHSASGVVSDLRLSKDSLEAGGIIAMDDFLNPKAITVSEGFYRFALEQGAQSVLPFAYCANKLFCADGSYVELYRQALWRFVEQMPNLPMVQEFNRQLTLGRLFVEQPLLDSNVLLF